MIADLSTVVTPSMISADRLAVRLEGNLQLPAEVAREAAAGFTTGVKAVVNGFATAVKDVATLGLRPGQLELIGVTQEDRDRGYDTSVAIATASGQILIAVGTGGIASALSKAGGCVVQVGRAGLIVFDAAGNAVGAVQGVLDIKQNGVTLSGGVAVAGGLLGLAANARGFKDLKKSAPAARAWSAREIDDYVERLPRKHTPRRSGADLYEIEHTGPYNHTVTGGGVSFDIDGHSGSTILEAKFAGKPSSSPFLPDSSTHPSVRRQILDKVRDELRRVRAIIESGETPFTEIEIITNTEAARPVFEGLLRELGLPGRVRVAP